MQERKIRIGVTLDRKTLDRLREEADLDSRPVSQYLNLMLIRNFASMDRKRKERALAKAQKQWRLYEKAGQKVYPALFLSAAASPQRRAKKDPQSPASPRSGRFRGPGESKPPAGFATFARGKSREALLLSLKKYLILSKKNKFVSFSKKPIIAAG